MSQSLEYIPYTRHRNNILPLFITMSEKGRMEGERVEK